MTGTMAVAGGCRRTGASEGGRRERASGGGRGRGVAYVWGDASLTWASLHGCRVRRTTPPGRGGLDRPPPRGWGGARDTIWLKKCVVWSATAGHACARGSGARDSGGHSHVTPARTLHLSIAHVTCCSVARAARSTPYAITVALRSSSLTTPHPSLRFSNTVTQTLQLLSLYSQQTHR